MKVVAFLLIVGLCLIYTEASWINCIHDWKIYPKGKGYWKGCHFCVCVRIGHFDCIDMCTTNPPTVKPMGKLPKCPETGEIRHIKVRASNDAVLENGGNGAESGVGSGEGSGEQTKPVKIGDYIVLELRKPLVLEKLIYRGQMGTMTGKGLVKYNVALSKNGKTFEFLQTVDVLRGGATFNFNKMYSAKFIKITIAGFKDEATLKFTLFGCKGDSCDTCEHPRLCHMQLVQCKLRNFCAGKRTCTCPSGYRLRSDNKTCVDINECQENNPCDQHCINLPGSYRCECSNGYRQVGKNKCEDINECAVNNGGCPQRCLNSPGSYSCECYNGYQYNKVTNQCTDIDECKLNLCTQYCENLPGSYKCSCKKGYQLVNNVQCIDINECTNSSLNKCDQESTNCDNLPGTYVCSCKTNFEFKDQYTCTAITCPSLPSDASKVVSPSDCFTANKKVGERCSITCAVGYRSQQSTPSTVQCQSDKSWKGTIPTCQAVRCPPLKIPSNGDVIPPACSVTGRQFGQNCDFLCNNGYNLKGNSTFVCTKTGQWNSQIFPVCAKAVQKPELTCGRDISVVLKKGKATANVTALWTLPVVKNIDPKLVNMRPATFDPARAPAGRNQITFWAKNEAGQDFCNVMVDVQDKEPPRLIFCPQNMYFKIGTTSTTVSWREPEFVDNVDGKNLRIDKNKVSGSQFTAGYHIVEYVAYDSARNSRVCNFTILIEVVQCKAPKIRNGDVSCNTFSSNLLCRILCKPGYQMYYVIPFALCNNGLKGFSNPIKDCVSFSQRESTEVPCAKGMVPQLPAGGKICVSCPIGMYYVPTGPKCIDCPKGKTTKTERSIGIEACQ